MVSPPRVPGKLRGTSPTCTRIIYTFIQEGPRDHVTECWVDGTQNLAAVHTQKSGQALPGPASMQCMQQEPQLIRIVPVSGLGGYQMQLPVILPTQPVLLQYLSRHRGTPFAHPLPNSCSATIPKATGSFRSTLRLHVRHGKLEVVRPTVPPLVVSQEFSTLAPSYLFTPTARRRCGRKLSAEDYYVLRYW
jgi:hypothetical protein